MIAQGASLGPKNDWVVTNALLGVERLACLHEATNLGARSSPQSEWRHAGTHQDEILKYGPIRKGIVTMSRSHDLGSSGLLRRRSLLKSALAAGACSVIPARSLFATGKSGDLVSLACCGIGNRGGAIIEDLVATGMARVVALCDTDMGAPHTQAILKQFPDVPRFQDFRKMFDQMGNDIQAVTVGVPDFAHFPITMLAASLGKHVYCEKPMARTFQEVALMMAAEKKYKVACQMGNQGHSGANYFQFAAWTKAGIIKNVTKIDAFMNTARRWHGFTGASLLAAGNKPKPDTLDWDTWLMSAAEHAYNRNYTPEQWRCWYEFGMGALGDWGAHILDTAHQFLELGLPTEVNAVRLDGHDAAIFPQASTLSFQFPARGSQPPCEVRWYDGVKNLPPLPPEFGDAVIDPNIPPPTNASTVKSPPGKVIYGEGLTFKGGSHASALEIIPQAKAKDLAATLPKYQGDANHAANFLKACKGEETCRSSFAVAGPLSQMMCLGVLAQRLNTRLIFDPATRQITNNKAANELLIGAPPRQGWEQFYKL